MIRVLLVGLIALAQTTTTPTARIAGVVVEESSGQPVADARITLRAPFQRPTGPGQPLRPREATTDSAGRFLFEGLDADGYGLSVTKPGYAPSASNALVANFSLAAGESRDFKLTLQRGGVIAGRVVDAAGMPVVDARVAAMRATVSGQTPMLMQAGEPAQTNDLGEFRVFGLGAGEYYVVASERPSGPFGGSSSQSTALVATYFPSEADTTSAQAIMVKAGETMTGTVVTMRRVSVFTISGVVVDDNGARAANARITLMTTGMNVGLTMGPPRMVQSEADGAFEITAVPPGQYMLTAVITPTFTNSPPPGAIGAGTSGGFSSSMTVGPGGGITTETRNGVTMQYRTAQTPPIPVAVSNAAVVGLRIVAPRPQMLTSTPRP